jgi:energy-coupling factor transport system substrate-specific component
LTALTEDNDRTIESDSALSQKPNVLVTQQQLTETLEVASAEVALEPPDSGDFHETFAVPDGSGDVAILVGDVTGHGAAAAVKANTIRREVVARLKKGDSALETVKAANAISQSDDDQFSTLFVAKINGRTGEMHYANAGHERPFVENEEGDTTELDTTGPPLGVLPPEFDNFTEQHVKLPPGGALLVTTDGVSEARRSSAKELTFFGHMRLTSLFHKVRYFSPVKIVSKIIRHVLRFSGSLVHDDIVVLALKRKNHHNDRCSSAGRNKFR